MESTATSNPIYRHRTMIRKASRIYATHRGGVTEIECFTGNRNDSISFTVEAKIRTDWDEPTPRDVIDVARCRAEIWNRDRFRSVADFVKPDDKIRVFWSRSVSRYLQDVKYVLENIEILVGRKVRGKHVSYSFLLEQSVTPIDSSAGMIQNV